MNLDIIKMKLCKAIDSEGNVLENAVVLEIISQLHSLDITTEELERTRLGKYVNLIRKKTTEQNIANKARALVKKWKKLISAKPDLANGVKRKCSRENTPLREMGPRADTPLNFQDSSRESTPQLTNGDHPDHAQDLQSKEDGVEYNTRTYSWTEAIPIKSEEPAPQESAPPRYVVLPYVCLD